MCWTSGSAGERAGGLWYRLMQPDTGPAVAEAVGRLSYRDTWMYVTDGGHYDNLGLVEALHRGADRIVVLDASGDKADTWSTLGGAIALARTDAGVQITLNPSDDVGGPAWIRGPGRPPLGIRHVHQAAARRGPGLPAEGRHLGVQARLVGRCALGRPGLRQGHSTFPCDSTLEQLYDVAEFEAYHQLGAASAAGRRAALRPAAEAVPVAAGHGSPPTPPQLGNVTGS